jgi:hypothetical protein
MCNSKLSCLQDPLGQEEQEIFALSLVFDETNVSYPVKNTTKIQHRCTGKFNNNSWHLK